MQKLIVEFPKAPFIETPCIKVRGDFHHMEAMKFKTDLLNFIQFNDCDCIVDIRAVKEMDLTALNALVIAQKKIKDRAKKLYIKTNSENPIFELLDLSKFDRHFNLKIAA